MTPTPTTHQSHTSVDKSRWQPSLGLFCSKKGKGGAKEIDVQTDLVDGDLLQSSMVEMIFGMIFRTMTNFSITSTSKWLQRYPTTPPPNHLYRENWSPNGRIRTTGENCVLFLQYPNTTTMINRLHLRETINIKTLWTTDYNNASSKMDMLSSTLHAAQTYNRNLPLGCPSWKQSIICLPHLYCCLMRLGDLLWNHIGCCFQVLVLLMMMIFHLKIVIASFIPQWSSALTC